MAYIHTYNPVTGDYVATTDDYGYPTSNASNKSLPPRPWIRKWPRWNGQDWELIEDHRERRDWLFAPEDVQEATEFWLPGDTHETPGRKVYEPGPLPEGAMLEKPAKPAPTVEELFTTLRAERDKRIEETDYMAMPDYPLTDAKRKKLLAYRQALRDLPGQKDAPWDGGGEATPWPVKP